MKKENTTTEAERFAKAFNQLANAIGNLCKSIRKVEQKDFATGGIIPKTHPFYGMPMVDWLAGMYENGLYKKFHEAYNVSLDHKVTVDFAKSAAYNAVTFMQDEKVIEASIKAFKEAVKKYAFDDDATYPNYVCIKDVDNFYPTKKGTKLKFHSKVLNDVYYFWKSSCGYQNIVPFNFIKENPDFFREFETQNKILSKEVTNKFNDKYPDYICIKDLIEHQIKRGDIFRYKLMEHNSGYYYKNISSDSKIGYTHNFLKQDYRYHFEVDQDKIEFHDKDGYAWFVITKSNKFWQDFAKKKAEEINPFEIKKNPDGSYYFEISINKKATPLANLQKEVIAEQLTKLDEKFYKDQGLEFKCEELIEKFMPLVTKWKFEGNTIVNQEETYSGVWSYSDNNKRKAAIKIAILHCELLLCKIIHAHHYANTSLIKNQLEKMLAV